MGSVEEQLRRILSSKAFAQSARMRRFLRFVVESSISGQSDRLKEYVLGIEVFDRRGSYDPRVDPIVRVEARRLRAKLTRYYEGEGRADETIIELPKGTYAPVFSERSATAEPAVHAIAVLPFSNLGTEPAALHFGDGLTEELIHRLTNVSCLRVVAANSAVRVSAILSGSVRSSSGRLRVIAHLIDAAHGLYLWSETYDRRMPDAFALQQDISCAIVTTILQIDFAANRRAVGSPGGRRLAADAAYAAFVD